VWVRKLVIQNRSGLGKHSTGRSAENQVKKKGKHHYFFDT